MPLDIVIFGVIAVILIFRFLGVLGQNDKDDGRPRRDAFGDYRKSVEKKQALHEEARVQREEKKVHLEKREDAGGAAVSINDKAFLEGAKAAFAMTLESYSTGDQERLKALLDKEMFAHMKGEIEKRQKAEERLEISLLEIVEARISERTQDERFEQIAVIFTSKQCHLLFDKDNKLIEGDPDEEELLCDLWTFRQNLASQDPTWFLYATRSQAVPKAKVVSKNKKAAKKKTSAKSQKAA